MPLQSIQRFLKLESAAGLLLIAAAGAALVADNSPLRGLYDALFQLPVAVQVGALKLHKPLLLWINDGLMAVFFLLVGLEIKREILEGELSSRARAALPCFAAAGGMAAPALIYLLVNRGSPETLAGWAIPAATDIAFALGVLQLVGPRVPLSLKVFLTALAILDDLGAIVIIAVFYSGQLSWLSLALGAACSTGLVALNRARVTRLAPYVLLGIALWICVLKSGVHATLAGVVLALAIPLAPARQMEEALHPWVAYLILPLFAFANAGVSLAGLSPGDLFRPLPLGIALGLFAGKQVGVFASTWLAVRLGIGERPQGASWLQIYGVALIAGIGFTMSLFIGTLAFDSQEHAAGVRIGVICGSVVSGLAGFLVLRGQQPVSGEKPE